MQAILRALIAVLRMLPDDTIRALARALFSKSWRRFEEATRNPRAVQEERLRLIVERAKDTAFGKEHGFAEIRSLADYRARVPIRTYDELEPWLLRMTRGEPNVLIPDRPRFYARTSGTTGRPKSIPVTDVYTAEYRVPRRVWMRQVAQAFPGLIRGKVLTIHSPRIEGHTEDGTPYGSITVAFGSKQDAGEVVSSPTGMEPVPRRVFLLEDFEKKYYLTLRMAAQENVTLAAAVNPSTLVLLAKKLDQHWEAIARDLEEGTCRHLEGAGEPLEDELRRAIRRVPEAARRIRESKEKRGRVVATDLWPNLAGLLCWKGGSAPFFLAQLETWYPGLAAMDYGYLATEGGFSIPLSPEGAKGVVAVTGHVIEFVPEEARAAGRSEPALLADELEVGRRYRVVVTGSHGLYRYDINDVVECVGRYHATAEVVFVHKGGNMLSITGEKIAESHVVEAFSRAAERTGIALSGFCVSAELADPPRYLFGVEPERELDAAGAGALLSAIEDAMCAVNIEYGAKRSSLRLGPPVLKVLEKGAFERERARRVAEGAPDSHVKPPHLVKDPARLEALGVARVVTA